MPPASRRTAALLGVILALGFCFRLAVISSYRSTSPDGHQYFQLSQELIAHGRLAFALPPAPPTYARMPGYPLFLAYVTTRTLGPESVNVWRATLANCVLDALSALLLFILMRLARLDDRVGLTAAIGVFLCPVLFLFGAYSLTESLSTCLGLAALVSAYAFGRTRHWLLGVAAGLAAGCAFLVRSDMITLAPALVLAVCSLEARARQNLARLGLVLLAAVVVVAPWGMRNARLFGALHLTAAEWPTQDGVELPTGPMTWMRTWAVGRPNDGDLSGYFVFRRPFRAEEVVLPRMVDSAAERVRLIALLNRYAAEGLSPEVDASFVALARDRSRSHPFRTYVTLPLRRLASLYRAAPRDDYPLRVAWLGLPKYRGYFEVANWIVYSLATVGAVILWRERRRAFLLVLLTAIAARSALHAWAVPTFVNQRYLVEVVPLMIGLAAVAVVLGPGHALRLGRKR